MVVIVMPVIIAMVVAIVTTTMIAVIMIPAMIRMAVAPIAPVIVVRVAGRPVGIGWAGVVDSACTAVGAVIVIATIAVGVASWNNTRREGCGCNRCKSKEGYGFHDDEFDALEVFQFNELYPWIGKMTIS